MQIFSPSMSTFKGAKLEGGTTNWPPSAESNPVQELGKDRESISLEVGSHGMG